MTKKYLIIFLSVFIILTIYVTTVQFSLFSTFIVFNNEKEEYIKENKIIVDRKVQFNQSRKSLKFHSVTTRSSTRKPTPNKKQFLVPNLDFEKFEKSCCYLDYYDVNLTQSSTFQYHDCPKNGIVTVQQIGALGNVMWEYAATWSIARTTGLKPYVPRCIRKQLDKVFESLSIPTLAQIIHCPINASKFIRSHKSWDYKNQSILLPIYAQITSIVVPWIAELRKEFKIRKDLLEQAYKVLRTAAKSVINPVYIGIHIRRTNYFHHLKVVNNIDKGAGPEYFFKAIEYYESKYPSVVFVLVSDDPDWCNKTFKAKTNVYVASNKDSTPGQDMAIMSVCNHSLIDYGTYGQWGAFLAGGEVLYFKSESILDDIANMLPNWHYIL